MRRGWRFELGRVRATARIGYDYLRAFVSADPRRRSAAARPLPSQELVVRSGAGHGPLPSRIRLVSWNIHRAYDRQGVAAGLRAVASDLEPHVLLLQEVPVADSGPWWEDAAVVHLLADHNVVFAPMHRVARPTAYYPFRLSGLMVAVRAGFDDCAGTLVPAACPPKLGPNHRIERVALGVRCRIGDVDAQIWNAHLENTARPSGRAAQARALAATVGDGPAVIGGDFNTMFWPFEHVDDALEGRGFHRVPVGGGCRPVPQLDHLFVRGFRPLEMRRLPIRGSDHLPIYGHVELER